MRTSRAGGRDWLPSVLADAWWVAHRGDHAVHRENSLDAIRAAVLRGYPVEIDVRLTADDRVVLLHDRSLIRRLARPAMVDRIPYAEIAADLPTLESALELATRGMVLELKTDGVSPERMADAVAPILVAAADAPSRVLVQSFDPRVLGALARRLPSLVRVQLAGARRRRSPRWMAAMARVSHPHGFGIDLRHFGRADARRLRARGLGVLGWTARTPADLRRARRLGVDLVMADPMPPAVMPIGRGPDPGSRVRGRAA